MKLTTRQQLIPKQSSPFFPLLLLLQLVSIVLLLSSAPIRLVAAASQNEKDTATTTTKGAPDESFFLLCSGGDAEKLQAILEAHPDWVNARTENGETCLHLTGILGQTAVTQLLLEKGADPNIRSTFEQGLRMHPLSWNVYGNHYDNCKLLLEYGADVNQDFDLLMGDQLRVVTVMDILQLLKGGGNEEQQQQQQGASDLDGLERLLLKYGAKTMDELKPSAASSERKSDQKQDM